MVAALAMQMRGQTDSWAIRWCYCESMNNMITILPRKSFVKNIGWGNTGTHTKEDMDPFHTDIESEGFQYQLEQVDINRRLMREFRRYFSRFFLFFDKLKNGNRKKVIRNAIYDRIAVFSKKKE